jgi:hypothetical protein
MGHEVHVKFVFFHRGSATSRPPILSLNTRRASSFRRDAGHQTLKNRILLENYYLPGDLERSRPLWLTTIPLHHAHLAVLSKRRGFVDQTQVPWGYFAL